MHHGSWRLDAFATLPGEGNLAEVVLERAWPETDLMQRRAATNGAPATAFLVDEDDGYAIRWFSRTGESTFCGHASLAAAHVVLEILRPGRQAVELRGGTLRVRAERRAGRITLEVPAVPASPIATPAALVRALGVEPVATLDAEAYVAVLKDEDAVRRVTPDLERIAGLDRRSVAVTAPGRAYDLVTRYFAPSSGVGEDHATGSVHRALAPWWAERLGRRTLHARQLSPTGADLWLTSSGARVWIGGHVRGSSADPVGG